MYNSSHILWQPADRTTPPGVSAQQWSWICHPGSLTQRLRQHCGEQLQLHLTYANWDNIDHEEQQLLQLTSNQQHWVRQIEWRHSGILWIAARTVIPSNCSTTLLNTLRHSGEQSIGDRLFAAPYFTRTPLEVAQLPITHSYCQQLCHKAPFSHTSLWARRSIFNYAQDSLLVTEIFLPAFLTCALDNAI